MGLTDSEIAVVDGRDETGPPRRGAPARDA